MLGGKGRKLGVVSLTCEGIIENFIETLSHQLFADQRLELIAAVGLALHRQT